MTSNLRTDGDRARRPGSWGVLHPWADAGAKSSLRCIPEA